MKKKIGISVHNFSTGADGKIKKAITTYHSTILPTGEIGSITARGQVRNRLYNGEELELDDRTNFLNNWGDSVLKKAIQHVSI